VLDDAPPVLISLAPPWPPSPVPLHEQTATVPRNPAPRRNDPRLRTTKGTWGVSNAEREACIAPPSSTRRACSSGT
jgi:hypothetical protein